MAVTTTYTRPVELYSYKHIYYIREFVELYSYKHIYYIREFAELHSYIHI